MLRETKNKMKSLVYLDISKSNDNLIAQFCNDYNIPDSEKKYLLNDKKEGFSEYWFEITKTSVKLVAYRTLNSKRIVFNNMRMESNYKRILNSFSNYTSLKKEPISENLDVDDILDKISSFGIDSLTKREIDFLDSQS